MVRDEVVSKGGSHLGQLRDNLLDFPRHSPENPVLAPIPQNHKCRSISYRLYHTGPQEEFHLLVLLFL